MKIFLLLVTVLTITISDKSRSHSVIDRDVNSLYESAQAVVRGKIISVSGQCESERCITSFSLNVDQTFKGPEKETVAFCSENPIKLGEFYVVFIFPAKNKLTDCKYSTALDSVFLYSKYGSSRRVGSSDSSGVFIEDGKRYIASEVEYNNFNDEIMRAVKKRKIK